MNTHKVTNKNGDSFEFDCSKHPAFLKLFERGDGGCGHTNNLACSDCPVPNRGHTGSQCLEFTGTNDAHVKFKGLSIEPIEPVSNTYNLLELEEGEEYTCDDFPGYKMIVDDYALYSVDHVGVRLLVKNPLRPRVFRKIEKKLTFFDLNVGDKVVNLSGERIGKVIGFWMECVAIGEDDGDVTKWDKWGIGDWRKDERK